MKIFNTSMSSAADLCQPNNDFCSSPEKRGVFKLSRSFLKNALIVTGCIQLAANTHAGADLPYSSTVLALAAFSSYSWSEQYGLVLSNRILKSGIDVIGDNELSVIEENPHYLKLKSLQPVQLLLCSSEQVGFEEINGRGDITIDTWSLPDTDTQESKHCNLLSSLGSEEEVLLVADNVLELDFQQSYFMINDKLHYFSELEFISVIEHLNHAPPMDSATLWLNSQLFSAKKGLEERAGHVISLNSANYKVRQAPVGKQQTSHQDNHSTQGGSSSATGSGDGTGTRGKAGAGAGAGAGGGGGAGGDGDKSRGKPTTDVDEKTAEPVDPLEQIPTLTELLSKVSEQAAPDVSTFGIFLLNDANGSIMATIKNTNNGNPVDMIREVFRRWLRESESPTWKALIKALRSTSLNVLASDLEKYVRSKH